MARSDMTGRGWSLSQFRVFTTQHTEDVDRIGDLKLQATQQRSYEIPPFVRGGALLLGIAPVGAGFWQRH